MDIDYDKMHASADDFREAAKALQDFHTTKKLTRTNQLYKRDAKKLEGLERRLTESQLNLMDALPPLLRADAEKEETAKFNFDEFFASVANGYIAAQKNLDVASSEYLKTVIGQPHVFPSVFKIPKLAAEVKFALDKIDKETVGLIFYKNQTSSETRNEQTVHFEIIAAPPPPGVVAQMPTDVLISPVFVTTVFSKSRRGEIFDAIKKYKLPGDNTGTQTDKTLDRPNLLQDPDTVIIVSVDGDRRFLLTTANAGVAGNVGVWYFDFEAQPPALAVVRKFGGADANITLLRDLIVRLGDAQKKFLNKLA
jgi:hypothetical protein